jgi:hypothetical protein
MGSTIETKKSLAQFLLEAKTDFLVNMLDLTGDTGGLIIGGVWVSMEWITTIVNSCGVVLKEKSVVIQESPIPVDAAYASAFEILKRALMNFIKQALMSDTFPDVMDIQSFERMAEL